LPVTQADAARIVVTRRVVRAGQSVEERREIRSTACCKQARAGTSADKSFRRGRLDVHPPGWRRHTVTYWPAATGVSANTFVNSITWAPASNQSLVTAGVVLGESGQTGVSSANDSSLLGEP
jgi:hypothetical protein